MPPNRGRSTPFMALIGHFPLYRRSVGLIFLKPAHILLPLLSLQLSPCLPSFVTLQPAMNLAPVLAPVAVEVAGEGMEGVAEQAVAEAEEEVGALLTRPQILKFPLLPL